MKKPKELWVVFDPMDGPHLFKSKWQADRAMERWKREAGNDPFDSYWDMVGPDRYVKERKAKGVEV